MKFPRIHALRNVDALTGDDVLNVNFVGVKNIVLIHVADLTDGVAHDLIDRHDRFKRLVVRQIRNRDFAADDDRVALGEGLASDPAMGILRQARIKHRIGNGVANFVGVTFPDGFGRKNVTTRHG